MKRREEVIDKGDRVLELFEDNKRIVPYILTHSNACEDIISQYKIGSGAQGKVYKIKFRGDTKTYIMKKMKEFDFKISYSFLKSNLDKKLEDYTMKDIVEKIIDIYGLKGRISWRKLLRYNHLLKNEVPTTEMFEFFFLPSQEIPCKTEEDLTFNYNLDIEGSIKVEKGDYLCFSNVYSEAIISLLLTQLVREDICYHFTKFYAAVRCDEDINFFIEKMDNSLDNMYYLEDIHSLFTPANLFSIIASVYVMNDYYKICHNDMSPRNILIKESKRAHKTKDKKYIQYDIGDASFRFPMPKYIYKISDFGFASKFSHPQVLDIFVTRGMYEYVPNFNTEGIFDILSFVIDTDDMFQDRLSKEVTDLINDILHYITPDFPDESDRESFVEEMLKNAVRDVDVKMMKKIFKKYLVKDKDKTESTFIAVNYKNK